MTKFHKWCSDLFLASVEKRIGIDRIGYDCQTCLEWGASALWGTCTCFVTCSPAVCTKNWVSCKEYENLCFHWMASFCSYNHINVQIQEYKLVSDKYLTFLHVLFNAVWSTMSPMSTMPCTLTLTETMWPFQALPSKNLASIHLFSVFNFPKKLNFL